MLKLKSIICFCCFCVFLINLNACKQTSSESSKKENFVNNGKAKIAFTNEFHNFGKLESGEQISFSFKFQNTGDGILKIDSIVNDCGCMVVTFPSEDVLPSENNYVDVLFNSAGEFGRSFKQIKVFCNAKDEPTTLTIVAEVENPFF
ncbi:MAG: DUF1573 domain-containing protein [Mangrovibacterium sp.]